MDRHLTENGARMREPGTGVSRRGVCVPALEQLAAQQARPARCALPPPRPLLGRLSHHGLHQGLPMPATQKTRTAEGSEGTDALPSTGPPVAGLCHSQEGSGLLWHVHTHRVCALGSMMTTSGPRGSRAWRCHQRPERLPASAARHGAMGRPAPATMVAWPSGRCHHGGLALPALAQQARPCQSRALGPAGQPANLPAAV